jgi:hypothetical protein
LSRTILPESFKHALVKNQLRAFNIRITPFILEQTDLPGAMVNNPKQLQHQLLHPVRQTRIQRQNHPPLPVVLVRLNLAHCLAPNQL